MFLIDFSRQGFCAVISPVKSESTDKGKLVQSFSLPQVFYTTHCVNRFSERMKINENCIIQLDIFLNEAILSFGENEGFLTCSDGVFACELENERLIVKTYLNFDLLSDEQIKQFYGSGMISMLPLEYTADHISGADFVIDDVKPEAIILGDLYKEFNWEKLNKAFQTSLENNTLIIALHKNRYCKSY